MQLFPASERVPTRLIAIIGIIFAAMVATVLIVGLAGTSDDGRSTASVDTPAVNVAPARVAEPAPAVKPAPVAALPPVAPPRSAPPVQVAKPTSPTARPAEGLLVSHSVDPSTPSAPAQIKQYQGSPLDERLLFFPVKFPRGDWQPRGLRVDDAWFHSADGTQLHGWYCPSDKPTALILYLHGNGGNVTESAAVCRFLQKQVRASVLSFDYRGYGRSDGQPTVDGVVADARAARAWLAKQAGVPESAVVLMGRSLGGAVAVQLTDDVRPRGLILENTFSSLRAVAEFHLPELAQLVPPGKLDSAATLARYDGPLLQCHADADRTVPFASGEELYKAAPGPKEFFRAKSLGHNDQLPSEYYGKVMEFLAGLK